MRVEAPDDDAGPVMTTLPPYTTPSAIWQDWSMARDGGGRISRAVVCAAVGVFLVAVAVASVALAREGHVQGPTLSGGHWVLAPALLAPESARANADTLAPLATLKRVGGPYLVSGPADRPPVGPLRDRLQEFEHHRSISTRGARLRRSRGVRPAWWH